MSDTKNQKREHSIFFTILIPMLGLLIVEGFLFVAIFLASGVIGRLNSNDREMLDKQLESRKQYIESYLVETVGDLSSLTAIINERTKSLCDEGVIDIAAVGNSAADATPLLSEVTDDLIRTLREKRTSGVFLLLHTNDLTLDYQEGNLGLLPGICIHDMDPWANPSSRNEDLLFKCAPTSIVSSFGITSDTAWKPMFSFTEKKYFYDFDFFYRPFQEALDAGASADEAETYAYWGVTGLLDEDKMTMTYAVPLILADGTVYGVLGLELSEEYLQSQMPHQELFSRTEGTYVLATDLSDHPDDPFDEEVAEVYPLIISGVDSIATLSKEYPLGIVRAQDGGYSMKIDNTDYYAGVETFRIYGTSSPIEHRRWLLMGIVSRSDLLAFTRQVVFLIAAAMVVMLLSGVAGSVFIGRQISGSVRALSKEVAEATAGKGTIPELSKTGISEIDQLTGAITDLSQDIADVKALERKRIEHERDYDLLTGLMNRRAFYRVAEKIFASPEYLNHAAMVMLDLDNLKEINDTYGHKWGDNYIHHAASAFAEAAPADTLVARVSGDEFFLLYYGYEDYDEIDRRIDALRNIIAKKEFMLPEGKSGKIRVSGGVARAPVDGTEFTVLMRLADFAMYQAKISGKGRIIPFDATAYMKQSSVLRAVRELNTLLEDDALATYHFQPIFRAFDGSVYAYESLMRVNMDMLTGPEDVLQMARQTNRLADVEKMTWSRTLSCYKTLRDDLKITASARLFINSIANVSLEDGVIREIADAHKDLMSNVVIEITEAELMDEEATQSKRLIPGFSGDFALDDYGSGYNSQKTLLDLGPKYIKIDISIIRDIDTSSDKQRLVANVVNYAKERDMMIIAEGIETEGELRKCIELDVDLLQGFFLARPGAIPNPISDEALTVIRRLANRKGTSAE